MALENWVDKQDGIDDILAEDINSIANAVIETQEEINKIVIDQTYSPDSENAQSGKAVAEAVSDKQDSLVSGTNIKTINNQSILGSGNITIEGGSDVEVDQTYNPTSENAQSGKAVAEAISEKQYELIEEITVTEDLQKIERSYDLDGNMYAFRSILLISNFPETEEGRNKIESFSVSAKLNNNKVLSAFCVYGLNEYDNSTYQLIQNQNGFYNMVFSECISNNRYLNGYPARISSSFELGDYIKSIWIETPLSANIYSGTVIKIYGVRA